MSASNSSTKVRDQSTFLQRPTSAKTPDVSHILANIFGELYTKDALSTDVIKNLTISSDVDDEYHKRYVQRLKEAQMIKEKRIQEYAKLEKHILEARAKALAYEEREESKRKNVCDEPDMFGVPPAKSYFSYCLDDTLLKENGLLVPSDYSYKAKQPFVPVPRPETPESHLRETVSSKRRSFKKSSEFLDEIESSSNYHQHSCFDDIDELHKSGSELSDDVDTVSSNNSSDDEEVKKKKDKKLFWKDALRQEERNIDRNQLKRLEQRTNFLPNPRLDAARLGNIIENPETVFDLIPKCIHFDKYTTGKVYESTFEIRNTSKVAHQFRALPPKTQFFSLSLGQYPQGQSVIAPGLSASYNIRFAPDSLCTFEDEILVECSNGSKMILAILAKREPPNLTINSIINCGYCLVGQIKVCRFIIQNVGGDGRFAIFPKSSWPNSSFKMNVSSTVLSVQPFELQPSMFELHKGDVLVLEVVFKPPDIKTYEQEIVIVCDNCTSFEFKLVGQAELAEVEYIDQEDTTLATQDILNSSFTENKIAIDEFKDKLSTKIIRFPNLNPNFFSKKQFSIKNKSASPIDFSWAIYKPVMQDSLMNNELDLKPSNYTLDKDTCFEILPKQGTLERNETKVFEVIFSSTKPNTYSNVAHLILHGIPEINKQLMLANEIHKSVLNKEDTNTTDFIASVVELRGICEPFQFTLDPPAVYIPGQVYIHSTTRKSFRLINMSMSPINFSWKQILEPHIIQVEPSFGEIAAKSYVLMDVLITGTKPGFLNDNVACYVEFADEPVYLHVEAEFKGPECKINEAGLDFGLVQIGFESKSFVTLSNMSNLPAKYVIDCLEHQNLFKFANEGDLLPLETKKIEITFVPEEEIILNTFFEIKIQNGNVITVNCHAQAQRPTVSLLNSEVVLNELYLNVEASLFVNICNHSVLETEFYWAKPEGDDSSTCELQIDPPNGILKSKTVRECLLRIKSIKIGEIKDLRVACYVKDMEDPLILDVKGIVHGMSVDLFTFDNQTKEKIKLTKGCGVIDFGQIKVGQSSQQKLVIENKTAIHSNIRLQVKRFKTIDGKDALKDQIDPMKKSLKITDRFKLKDNSNGLGFGMDFVSHELIPFNSITLDLYALAEMWGVYEDSLLINVDGIPFEISLPMRVNVIDNPIKLYAGKVSENESEETAMVRFGSQTQESGEIVRKLKIFNSSWSPIDIEWKVFVIDPNDTKLVDVHLTFDKIIESDEEEPNEQEQLSNRVPEAVIESNRSIYKSIYNKSSFDSYKNVTKKSIESTSSSDYYESFFERVPIVKLNLTKHFGIDINEESASKVFNLSKNFMSLKPRERTSIDIIFNTNVNVCQDYEAVFVGYFNLPPNMVKGEGFHREISFSKEPICFKATAKLESPNLVVELSEDLHFDVSLGDLINEKNELINQKMYNNQFSLLNSSLAPIEFDLKLSEPFFLANEMNNSKRIQLKPKSKTKVDVYFKLSLDTIQQTLDMTTDNLFLQSSVHVNFSESFQQLIPISAKIYTPHLNINKSSIDFGICLVGQERYQQLLIRNPSFSSAVWRVYFENNEHQVFRCDKETGVLKAIKLLRIKSEQLINIYFTAKHDVQYKTRLVLEMIPSVGMENIYIDLEGIGSYDEKLEAVLNV